MSLSTPRRHIATTASAALAAGKPSFRGGPATVPTSTTPTTPTTGSKSSSLTVVPLTPALVPGLLRVQYAAYDEDLHETAESYMDKLTASPGTSFVALCPAPVQKAGTNHNQSRHTPAHGGAAMVVGYAVALAVPRYFLPALDSTSTAARLAEACAAVAMTRASEEEEATATAEAEAPVVDTLYLHDVAVDPAFRGQRVAGHLLREAEAKRQQLGLSRMALIAVRGADKFWKKVGFKPVPASKLPNAVGQKLEGYGAEAVYMEKLSGAVTPARAAPQKTSSL